MRVKKIILNSMKVALTWVVATCFAIALNHIGIHMENMLLVYVVGVVLCSVETSSMYWGIGSAIGFAFTCNFLFTIPRYSMEVDDPNHVFSFFIFVIVALIVTSLTVKLRRQMELDHLRTQITSRLNEIGNGFLNLSGQEAIIEYTGKSLNQLTGKSVKVLIKNEEKQEFSDRIAEWCYANSRMCGYGEIEFSNSFKWYVPVRNSSKTYGVLIFDCSGGEIKRDEKIYIETITSQMILVLERENLNKEKEETQLQMEKEHLKSTLLRSISHDIRTPLTGIAGSANFLFDNFSELNQEVVTTMLDDICTDAQWLNAMVENLLNMTRIQEGRIEVHKKKEIVDDLISEAVVLVSKRLGNHRIEMETPEDIVLFPADGHLFLQALVNLIDNAIRHSGDGSTITVSAKVVNHKVLFTVSDDGVGIREDKLEQIFDSFFTTAYENGDRKRGAGLGLAICKAIAEAHGGSMKAFNNQNKGASFQIEMPMEENTDE